MTPRSSGSSWTRGAVVTNLPVLNLGSSVTVRGLVVNRGGADGIHLQNDSTVAGCFIGTERQRRHRGHGAGDQFR